jgi:transcriptional regulator with XRE-family HTH domain
MRRLKVKAVAQAKGWSQDTLARESGLTFTTVRRIWRDRGTEDPRLSTLSALATALGVSIDDLYETVADDSLERRMSLVLVAG